MGEGPKYGNLVEVWGCIVVMMMMMMSGRNDLGSRSLFRGYQGARQHLRSLSRYDGRTLRHTRGANGTMVQTCIDP